MEHKYKKLKLTKGSSQSDQHKPITRLQKRKQSELNKEMNKKSKMLKGKEKEDDKLMTKRKSEEPVDEKPFFDCNEEKEEWEDKKCSEDEFQDAWNEIQEEEVEEEEEEEETGSSQFMGYPDPSRFRSILVSLKNQDSTMQLIALQELSEILSVSSEENLAGYFSSDNFIKELVRIMKSDDIICTEMDDDMMLALAMSEGLSGGNPEIMLLACRCICNLLDAMPTAVTTVVFHGAIRVLCQKLKSIQYIDLAEQALYALEKIAGQLPRAVVHEGGLSAALMYFDFFSIHAQRIALRTASNCMRSIDTDSFPQVLEITPTLMNTIHYSDRTVVELTCLCWVRISENYRNDRDCLERAISVDLIKTLFSLIPTPGNANAVRPSTFQDLLRIFRAISKSSPLLSLELLKLGIIDSFYQILTNNSQPIQLDSKWRDSVPTIMKIIVDLLPSLPKDDMFSSRRFKETGPVASRTRSSRVATTIDPRVMLFEESPDLVLTINQLLVPLILDIYTSTVNLRVRQLVTHTFVKLIHYSNPTILTQVFKSVPLSSFLSGILTRQEHPTLVLDALYQTELLIKKLPLVYTFLFEREGVIHEIEVISRLTYDEDSEPAEPLLRSRYDPLLQPEEKGIGKGSTRKHIVQLAQYFIQHYTHSHDQQGSSLKEITEIAADLECLKPEKLKRLSDYLSGSNMGISSFEFINSGLMKSLLVYLTKTDDVGLFEQMFSTDSLKKLVERLQEILSRFESFEVVTPLESSSSDNLKNPTSMLAKQLRIRLVGEGSDIPNSYKQLMVSTHAVATFRVLEEYLLARIQAADEDDDEDEEESEHFLIEEAEDMEMDDDGDITMNETVIMKEEDLLAEEPPKAESSSQVKEGGGWKIRFFMRDKLISNDTTVYAAVHQYKTSEPGGLTRTIWNSSFPVTYKRIWVPASDKENKVPDRALADVTQPEEMNEDSVCYQVLMLMKALSHTSLPKVEFINRKLTAKMNRQLEEPLIVASACLPDWAYWLMNETPFLFPFETRYLFIQSTSFGYARLIGRWQSIQSRNPSQPRDESHQPSLGRMERQKVRIARHQMLESATKILDLFGSLPTVLEIEYVGEEGTGLGPTLEFYAATSKEFSKNSLDMWRGSDKSSTGYVHAPLGLFPKSLSKSNEHSNKKIVQLFKTLGQFVAKALLDFRIIDIFFSPAFFKILLNQTKPSLELIKEIDPVLAKSLGKLQLYVEEKRKIYANNTKSLPEKMKAVDRIVVDGARLSDLCLDFTLPGDPSYELKDKGSGINVTIHNVEEYLDLVVDSITGSGISQQISAFRDGFNGLFSIDDLHLLSYSELVSLFGKANEDWSYATLSDTIKADHGFSMESEAFKHLLEILSEMDSSHRRQFLQFTTGSPRLPIGGWKALRPVFTVVRKVPESPLSADDYLPSVMTCANYLKMPEYSTKSIMQLKLDISMTEGQNSFLLS
ncbi:hypothetical protein BDB01DRAFT_810180 [Pilobolus umbonatus]|nr:hypothetical protein BDB01DRAFT_810180 [Pilobolus umbonatus]